MSLKKFLMTFVITLSSIFAFTTVTNASTINEINFNTNKAVIDEEMSITGTTDVTGTKAEIVKWYLGGTTRKPGHEFTPNGEFKSNVNYIVQVKYTPSTNNTFDEYTDFYMNDNYGYIVRQDETTGEVYINFYLPTHYRVSFVTNTSDSIDPILVEENEVIEKLPTVSKTGYTFYGWLDDNDYTLGNYWSNNDIVDDHLTLYALLVDNSKIVKSIDISVPLPKVGTKFKIDNQSNSYYINQLPIIHVTTNNDSVNYIETKILKDLDSYDYFTGTIESNKDYNFYINLGLEEDYFLATKGLTVTVNGKKFTSFEYQSDRYLELIYKTKVSTTKKANTMKIAVKNKKVKYKKVKANKVVLNNITVTKPQGVVTYEKTKGNKKIKIDKTTGKVTVKKGIKKGTYYVTVKVTAKGNNNYKSVSKSATFMIKVK